MIQRLSRRQRRRTSFGCTLKKTKIMLSELHFKFKSSTDNEKASLWAIFKLEVKRNSSLTVTRSWAAKHEQRSGVNFKEPTSRGNNAVIYSPQKRNHMKIYCTRCVNPTFLLTSPKHKASLIIVPLSKQTRVFPKLWKIGWSWVFQQPYFLQQFCQYTHLLTNKCPAGRFLLLN